MSPIILLACVGLLIDPPEGPHERAGDAYVPMARIVLAPSMSPIAGGFAGVQVNTIGGLNVLDDAANEPSIVVDPTAPLRMAVGWRQFDTTASSFRQAGYSYSVDGGRTWSGTQVIEPGIFRTDPVLRASSDGTMYYLSLVVNPYSCDLFASEDGGATWPTKAFAYGGDKSWIGVDTTGGIGNGQLYQGWNIAGNQFAPALFNRSAPGGQSWEDPVEYSPGGGVRPVFGITDVGPDGEVYVAGIPNGANSSFIWVVRSDDAKDRNAPFPTFTAHQIDPKIGSFQVYGYPPNPNGLLGQVNLSVDRSGGPFHGSVYVLATWNEPARRHIAVMRSDDGGETWTEPMAASDDLAFKAWRWMGSMAVAPNGRIDVVFNDNREAPRAEPNLTRTYYTFSMDGGVSWSADQPIGPQWDSHVGWPSQNKIGDYYDIQSDLLGADLIYAATYNGEQDVYFARLGPYDCNGNGTDDELDVAEGASGDCNRNGIPDECEIAAGTLVDADGDGVADLCACPADVNGDGVLNILDFVAFQLLWQQQDPGADCDRSGAFDVLDFVCYQGLFVAGCR
jgi:hypothetical protein